MAQPYSPQHSRSKAMMLPGASQVLNMSMSKASPSSLVPHFVTIIREKYSIKTTCVASHNCHLWSCCTAANPGETEQPPGALPCWGLAPPYPMVLLIIPASVLCPPEGTVAPGALRFRTAGASQELLPCRAWGLGPKEVQRSARAAWEVGEGRGFGTALMETSIHSQRPLA